MLHFDLIIQQEENQLPDHEGPDVDHMLADQLDHVQSSAKPNPQVNGRPPMNGRATADGAQGGSDSSGKALAVAPTGGTCGRQSVGAETVDILAHTKNQSCPSCFCCMCRPSQSSRNSCCQWSQEA